MATEEFDFTIHEEDLAGMSPKEQEYWRNLDNKVQGNPEGRRLSKIGGYGSEIPSGEAKPVQVGGGSKKRAVKVTDPEGHTWL